jgi:hypothetical protein
VPSARGIGSYTAWRNSTLLAFHDEIKVPEIKNALVKDFTPGQAAGATRERDFDESSTDTLREQRQFFNIPE